MFHKLIVVVLVLTLISCSHGVVSKPVLRNHILLSCAELNRAGIDGVEALHLALLVEKKVYLLSDDGVIARFSKDGKAEKRYHAKGQGPGEFQKPRDIFRYDSQTIAVFDLMKGRLLLFDDDLNFEREINLRKQSESQFRKIKRSGSLTYAFGDFGTHYLALLDNDFYITTTYRKIPTEVPFKHIYPSLLYMAYLLNNGEIAATSWVYYSRDCVADIFNTKTGQVKASLRWKSPISLTQADVTARKNLYGCRCILKAGKQYVVETGLTKTLKNPNSSQLELIVFDEKGTLVARMKTQYDLITTNEERGSRIYFVDDKDNISYWEVGENWPWK